MEHGCPLGDRDARKVELLEGGGRDWRNIRPDGGFVGSDPTRFAEPSVGFDVRELQSEERQCQLVETLGNPNELAEWRVERFE